MPTCPTGSHAAVTNNTLFAERKKQYFLYCSLRLPAKHLQCCTMGQLQAVLLFYIMQSQMAVACRYVAGTALKIGLVLFAVSALWKLMHNLQLRNARSRLDDPDIRAELARRSANKSCHYKLWGCYLCLPGLLLCGAALCALCPVLFSS